MSLYGQTREAWKKAAAHYEDVVQHEGAFDKYSQLATAYFFLGNSYDQLYKPAKQGDATNDAYIQKSDSGLSEGRREPPYVDPKWKKSSLEYLAAAYGSDKLNDAGKGPNRSTNRSFRPRAQRTDGQLPGHSRSSTRTPAGYDDAEAPVCQSLAPPSPTIRRVLASKAGYYNRQGDFYQDHRCPRGKAAALEPNNPEGYHRVAVFYWDKANETTACRRPSRRTTS